MQALSYADDRLTYKWRNADKRAVIITAVLVLVGVLGWVGRRIYVRSTCLYWQHRCATFGPIPLDPSHRSAAIDVDANRCWESYSDSVGRFGTYVPVGFVHSRPLIMFMHEMVCPSGRHEVVELAVDLDSHGSYDLLWRTVGIDGFSEPGPARYGFDSLGLLFWRTLVIDSATPDASNPSHLVLRGHEVDDNTTTRPFIIYNDPPGPRVLDLWLQNDGTFKIVKK